MVEVLKVSLFCILNLCSERGQLSIPRNVTEQLVKREMSIPGIQPRSFRAFCSNLLLEISSHHCLLFTRMHSLIIIY